MEYGAVLTWWVLFTALAIAGLPLTAHVLRELPDRGASLALPVALTVVFFPVYWGGRVSFGPGVVFLGILVLIGLAARGLRTAPPIQWTRFGEAWLVFTVAFGLLVAVRAVDPSVVPIAGEKFLDYGLLNSLLRGTRLPPADMWFAGHTVQYYYGGHLIAAVLTTLTGTPPQYAYNLALAGFYGTLVAAAYGVAGSLAAAGGARYRLGGGLGAVLVGFASNLVTPLQSILWLLPERTAHWLAAWIAVRSDLEASDLLALSGGSRVPFYWIPSRVIPETINEFPLFAFVNGDLHAHMMSTPFLLLVVGLAFAYYRTDPAEVWRRRALVFGVIPPVAGLLAVVNTWSFPSAAGITWLALVFATADPRELLRLVDRVPAGEVGRLTAATLGAGSVFVLGVLWVLPFFIGPATGAGNRSLEVLPDRSGLIGFTLVHGGFLVVFAVFLARHGLPRLGERRAAVVLVALAAVAVGVSVGAAAVGLVLPLFVAAWVLLRRQGGVGFETVVFLAGAGLVLIVEFVFVSEQAGPGRMNTVFKTYMQVWVLWAVAAGAMLAGVLARRQRWEPDWHGLVIRGAGAVLVVSLAVYGVVALGVHFQGTGEPSLDATQWARSAHADEWAAIEWLGARAGQPTIVTTPGCWCHPPGARPYDWVNAPSSFTGIPTVAGWAHEVGYRGSSAYETRVADVRVMYTGSDADRADLLREYDVAYVYVGPTERSVYEEITVATDPDLMVVYEDTAVTVYAVREGPHAS